MIKTLFTLKDLSERWGVSKQHILDLESRGFLKRTMVGKVTYPINQVNKLEEYQSQTDALENIIELRQENKKLKFENENYKNIIKGYQKILGGFEQEN